MVDCVFINSPDELFSGHYVADPKVPLGLLYISSFLEAHNYTVKIIDCHTNKFTKREILGLIAVYEPKLVGLNITSPNRKVVFDLVNAIKEEFNSLPVIVGGPHATSLPDDIFNNAPQIDGVVIGEGEYTVFSILGNLPDIISIPGFYTSDDFKNRRPKRYSERVSDLNSLPFPNFDLLEIHKYIEVSPELYLTCSRGCRYDCAFCSVRTLLGRTIQYRTAENVIDEMMKLRERYRTDRFYFYDDDLVIWPELKRFCELNAGNGLFWTAQATINDIKEEHIKVLANSGCYRLSFGFESGSHAMQKYIGKVIRERAIQMLPVFKSFGIATRGYFILGFPQESIDDICETLMYILRLKQLGLDDISVFPARPYPGTRLFTQCVELFGEDKIPELLDFYYVNDHEQYADASVRERLHRYNTLPAFQINRYFQSEEIRSFIALAFTVFFNPDTYEGITKKEMMELLMSTAGLEMPAF